ncbi:MAG: hypothetical protein HXM89_05315 [Neisseria sp.]|uniref:DarT1-associated NADAR antitoxin family protein n=1 Tax=unclassified Neisseria TaxID=2623750 RepID=UPI0008A97415|nr:MULTISPECIES: hypothetical protein [unclassified Neisseria]MBF1270818.1 hypothetical protein [Neisseria sp.]OHR11798.1 hypothetical protein HMPREF2596_10025 [Neisseria sp. HMSC078C12]
MAQRPIYIPQTKGDYLVQTDMLDFKWFPGMAISQKQKSIRSLHEAALEKHKNLDQILEISSKSETSLGIALSAFNLMVMNATGKGIASVECVFQSSKVFEGNKQFLDLLKVSSLEAKKDPRLKESGRLIAFRPNGKKDKEWGLNPITAYYDWVYINALKQHEEYHEELLSYDAFSDIEFNPKKSINCQAYSVALFCALSKRGILCEALSSQQKFLSIYYEFKVENAASTLGL